MKSADEVRGEFSAAFEEKPFLARTFVTQSEDVGALDGLTWKTISSSVISSHKDAIFDNLEVFQFFLPALVLNSLEAPLAREAEFESLIGRFGAHCDPSRVLKVSGNSNVLELALRRQLESLEKIQLLALDDAFAIIASKVKAMGDPYMLTPGISKVRDILEGMVNLKD